MTETKKTAEPIEIAYHTPGKGWKRKSFKTEAAARKFVEKLDSDVEVRWAR